MVSGLSFVYEFFHSTGFSLDAEQSVLHGMLVMPRIKSLVPCLRESTLKVGAQCRTMSHDVARRPKQYVL